MCALIRYLRFMGIFLFLYLSFLLSWMYEHICLDTCCFGVCVLYLCICTYLAQLSMFHMKRRSRHTLIIITKGQLKY